MAAAVHDPLEMRAVTLRRGGRMVLHSVDASFAAATVTSVVGPSGAGKTSLLRCLNRLDEPEEGTVLLDGQDVRKLEPTELRKRVGMIFQTPVLFDGGIRSNLTYGLNGVVDERLIGALNAAGLDASFLDRDSTAVSVGQAQRICIARALLRNPEVLLMDEPTSALDKDAAARVERLITELSEQGYAVVVVTHDLQQAKRVAKRAFLLVDGRITASGDPDQIEAAWPEEDIAR